MIILKGSYLIRFTWLKKSSRLMHNWMSGTKRHKIFCWQETYKTTEVFRLDQDYTVFGEIVSGIEGSQTINNVPTDKNDRPLKKLYHPYPEQKSTKITKP
ncbi:hypothetical protein CS542_09000 [Pedobacter sp. IW39]|nr:hypothetical protein CS542_09000 [Pedobacter sp. IW39]